MSGRVKKNSQWRRLLRNRRVVLGLAILALFAVLALAGPLVIYGDPNAILGDRNMPPSGNHPLGTTGQGQDLLLQLIHGARSSLSVGLLVGLLATSIGTIVGLAAAYYGGWIDDLLSLLTNVFIILPGLPLLVALAAFLPPGIGSIILVLTLTGWAGTGRVIRAQTASIRNREWATSVTSP